MGYFSERDIENKEKESYEDTNYDEAPATRSGMVANAPYVNIRRIANQNGPILGQLKKGEHVIIIGDSIDGYFRIQYKSYPEAYVAAHFIKEDWK